MSDTIFGHGNKRQAMKYRLGEIFGLAVPYPIVKGKVDLIGFIK